MEWVPRFKHKKQQKYLESYYEKLVKAYGSVKVFRLVGTGRTSLNDVIFVKVPKGEKVVFIKPDGTGNVAGAPLLDVIRTVSWGLSRGKKQEIRPKTDVELEKEREKRRAERARERHERTVGIYIIG